MNEMYVYMNQKLQEMQNSNLTTVEIGFAEFARLYQMVCFMMQIRTITNVWEKGERQ